MTAQMEGGGGVQVAPGDPGQLTAAAQAHAELSNMLEYHYSTIVGTANSVLGTWNGEAATAYQTLSRFVGQHYQRAGQTAGEVAAGLQLYASVLEECQEEGKHALTMAEHWLEEENQWANKLAAAENEVQAAQNAISQDSNPLFSGPFSGMSHAQAGAAVAAAGQQLAQAEGAVRTATFQVEYCKKQVIHWQTQGRYWWDQAEQAAESATGVTDIHITPPPLAGYVVPDKYIHAAAHHSFFSLHTVEDGVDWVWDRVSGGMQGFVNALDHPGVGDTPLGLALGTIAGATDHTVGLCVGGSVSTAAGRQAGGQVCVEGTPDGGDTVAVTVEAGPSTPASGGGIYAGPVISNGKVPDAQTGIFTGGGVTVGDGDVTAGGSVVAGTYKGKTVWDVEPTVGVGSGGVSVHGTVSDTWVPGG
jgi:hypothetical protein